MAYATINGVEVDEHDIYEQGEDAAIAGKPISDNPYDPDSYEGGVWEDGFNDYIDNQ